MPPAPRNASSPDLPWGSGAPGSPTDELSHDPAQALAAEKLSGLHQAIRGYEPGRADSWLARFGLANSKAPEPPRGLYLYGGGVGRGKSMLMDHVLRRRPGRPQAPGPFPRIHAGNPGPGCTGGAESRKKGGRVDDLLPAVANDIAEDAWLLCFDELHVVNIADAMILGRLFEALVRARRRSLVATLELAAGPALRGRVAAPAFPALHRAAQGEAGCAASGGGAGLPPGLG